MAWGVAHAVGHGGSRASAAAALVCGGLAGSAVIVAAHWILHSPELDSLRTPDFGFDAVGDRT